MRSSALVVVGLILASRTASASQTGASAQAGASAGAAASQSRGSGGRTGVSVSRSKAVASVRLQNGINVSFSVENQPGGTFYTYASNTIVRGFTDPANCTYFGYQVTVAPADGNRIEVSLGPLAGDSEEYVRQQLLKTRNGCASPQAITPAPRFPAPSVVDDGEGLSIDLLTNPQTGSSITDRIRVSRRAIVASASSDEPVRDLSLDEVPLGPGPGARFFINGEAQRGSVGCRGALVYLWLPQRRERFVFSLVPREGYDFRKVGVADGNKISFEWDGVQYAWMGEEPMVASGVRCHVWILKDDHAPRASTGTSDFLACGAGSPRFVLGGG